jgi:hypothetical protein
MDMLSRFAWGLLCASFIFICSLAFARGRCDCTISQFTDLEDLRDMIVKVAVYGTAEHRKTEQELADATGEKVGDIHERYSSTGTLVCAGNEGSAQVTLKNNIITTAAHMFFEEKTCKRIASPSDCVLTLKSLSGAEQKIKVKEQVKDGMGFKCPTIPTGDLDWAVLRLDGAATGVQPYTVEELPGKGLAEGTAVTLVAHSIDFWRKDSSGNKVFPKHIQRNCHITKVYGAWEPGMYKGDCDATGFSSGGSILVEGAKGPILSAIFSGQNETREQEYQSLNREEKDSKGRLTGKGVPNIAPYNLDTWSGYYVAVTGNFLRAIRSAAQ